MEKIVTKTLKPIEEIEREKTEIKELFEKVFIRAKELGVTIDVPTLGHATMSPARFTYHHKDEVWHLNYKV